jgi:hypothetical protein
MKKNDKQMTRKQKGGLSENEIIIAKTLKQLIYGNLSNNRL